MGQDVILRTGWHPVHRPQAGCLGGSTGVPSRQRWNPFFGIEQLDQVEVEDVEDDIRGFEREGTFAAKDVVNVGLGDAGDPRETPLGELAAAHAMSQVVEETALQFQEIH